MPTQAATAILTGASRGIGPYIARSMASAGYRLVLVSRSGPEMEAVAADLTRSGASALTVVADVTDPAAQDDLLRQAERHFGAVEVLVNNAGGDPQREFEAATWMDNEAIIRLNLLAPMELTHKLLPGMLKRRRGHIVNISAIAGRVGFPFTEAYAAAKDGLIGFTRVLRNDYHGRGVTASVVILGAIRGAGQGQRTADEIGLRLPRLGTSSTADVAEAVVRALRKDRAEVVVMPGPGRLLKAVMDFSPSLGSAMNQMTGSRATMQRVVQFRNGQRYADTP